MKACSSSSAGALTAELYGWEREGQYWHGPTELVSRRPEPLDPASARCAWKTQARLPGGLPLELATTARDLGDCALATIDLDLPGPGPTAIVAAVPVHRRGRIRAEFAFELASFARFLEGPDSTGSELAIHDQIERVLSAESRNSTVFALCLSACAGDVGIAVSEHIEQVSASLLHWLARRDRG